MQSSNIYSSSKGFYYVLKLLGLAPYGFDRTTLKFKVTFVNYLQFVAAIVVWLIMTSIEIASKSGPEYTVGVQSKLLESLWQYQFTFQHFLATSIVIYNFVNRKHAESFLSLLHSFDQRLTKLQWKVQTKSRSVWFPVNLFLLSTLLNVSYTILILALDGFSQIYNFMQVLVIINYFIVNEFFLMMAMQFIMSVNCINQRLNVLTENVCLLLPLNENEMSNIEFRILKNIGVLYDNLANAVDEVNSIFSKQLIAVFMPALVLEIFTAYSAIKASLKNIPIGFLPSIDFLLWNLYLVVPTFVAIFVSVRATNSGQNLKNYIENFSNYCENGDKFMKVNALAIKLQNRQITFTTDFFDINWSLALSILGTIATYMVIICQFENDL